MTKQYTAKFAGQRNFLSSNGAICAVSVERQFVQIAALRQRTHLCQTSERRIVNRTSALSARGYQQLHSSSKQHSSPHQQGKPLE
jgi:hypothetical protein